ncbi:MAB_1171c family putative transporter [Streptomyces lydicus]|uniref:MAB_1171c family putative transporter n=1 Tax=Streptomyces lydicus TaxID=47763 RepID=UPI00379ADF0F
MTTDLMPLGIWLETVSIVCMGTVVLLRAPAAARTPRQRGLWLALATATLAMGLSLAPVEAYIERTTGLIHLADMVTNLCGVLSAAAVLDLVAVTVSPGRRHLRARLRLAAVAVAVLTTLLLMDVAAQPHQRHTLVPPDGPVPSLPYWLILIGAHLVADAVSTTVCLRYGRRQASPSLRSSLWLFGLGTAFSCLYWLGSLALALSRATWVPPVLPTLMGLHGLLRGAALAIPMIGSARRSARAAAVCWKLWPLWRDLVQAVPSVLLHPPRSRMLELLWPQIPWELLAYRKVVEIRDAVFVLKDRVPPAQLARIKERVRALDLSSADGDALVMGCLLRAARTVTPGGTAGVAVPPYAHDSERQDIARLGGRNLSDDTTFLVRVAHDYRSPLAFRTDE